MSLRPRLAFLLFVAWIGVLSAPRAAAQSATEAEYRAARALLEQERADEAAAAYRTLAERSGEARAWLGLAVSTNLAGDPTLAATFVERALGRTDDPWLARNLATAENLATQFWPLVGRLIITCEVDGAEVWVDGVRVGTTPMASTGVVVASGERRVELRSADHEPYAVSLRVAPSDYAVTPEIQVTRRAVTLTPRAVRLVGRVTVSADVEGAAVFVDETYRATLPLTEPLVVDPGTRRIVVRSPGYEDSVAIVEVEGAPENAPAEPTAVQLELVRSAAGTSSGSAASAGGVSRTVKWSLIAAGGGLVAAAGVTSGLWASTHTDLDAFCADGACVNTAESRDTRDRFRALRLTSITLGGVGVAALVTGLALRSEDRPVGADVACTDDGCTATVHGRF